MKIYKVDLFENCFYKSLLIKSIIGEYQCDVLNKTQSTFPNQITEKMKKIENFESRFI